MGGPFDAAGWALHLTNHNVCLSQVQANRAGRLAEAHPLGATYAHHIERTSMSCGCNEGKAIPPKGSLELTDGRAKLGHQRDV